MKRITCAIILILILIFCSTPVTAATAEVTVELPEGFIGAKSGENLGELAEIYSMTDKELEDYYKQHNLLFFATNKENTCQVKVTCVNNDFSKSAVSFSTLSDSELETVAKELAGDSFQNLGHLTGKDGNKYIKLRRSLSDSGGVYTATEYITVCSGKLYTVDISVSKIVSQDNTEELFEGISITDNANAKAQRKNIFYVVLIVIGIAVLSAVTVILGFTVIRDIRRNKNTQ